MPQKTHAQSTCTNFNPASGEMVRCTFGNDTNGNPVPITTPIIAPSSTNVTVTIEDPFPRLGIDDQDAIMAGGNPTISLGNGASLNVFSVGIASVFSGDTTGFTAIANALADAGIVTAQDAVDFLIGQGITASVGIDGDGDEFIDVPPDQLAAATTAFISIVPAASGSLINLGGGAPGANQADIDALEAATTVAKAQAADRAMNLISDVVAGNPIDDSRPTTQLGGNIGTIVSNSVKLGEPGFPVGTTRPGQIFPNLADGFNLASNSSTHFDLSNDSLITGSGANSAAIRIGTNSAVEIIASDTSLLTFGNGSNAINAADNVALGIQLNDGATSIATAGTDADAIVLGNNNNFLFEADGTSPPGATNISASGTTGDNSAFLRALGNSNSTVVNISNFNQMIDPDEDFFGLAGGLTGFGTTGNNSPLFDFGGMNSSHSFTGINSNFSTAGDSSNVFNLGAAGSSDSLLSLLNSNVATAGNMADGVSTGAEGTSVNNNVIVNSTIETDGNGSNAVHLSGSNNGSSSTFFSDGSTFATQGDNAVGLLSSNGANDRSTKNITMNDFLISTEGNGSNGAMIGGAQNGSVISSTFTNGAILTQGNEAHGVVSRGGFADVNSASTQTFNNVDIATAGAYSTGIDIETFAGNNSISAVDISQSSIDTSGDHSIGVTALLGADVNGSSVFDFGENTVTTLGEISDGLVLNSTVGSTVDTTSSFTGIISDNNITTSGDFSYALKIGENVRGILPDASAAMTIGNDGAPNVLIDGLDQFTSNGMGSRSIQNDGTLLGGANGITFANNSVANIADNGLIQGAGGVAATFNNTDDTFELQTGSMTSGIIDAAGGVDGFVLGGEGTGTLDRAQIGTQFLDFETFTKEDLSQWTLTSPNDLNWTITGGEFVVADDNLQTGQTQFTVTTGKTRTENPVTSKDEIQDTVGSLTLQTGVTVQTNADSVNAVNVIEQGIVNLQNGMGVSQIVTTGDGANGIFGSGPNGVDITYNGAGMSGIDVQGQGSAGVLGEDAGNGDIFIRSNGNITGSGQDSSGIVGRSTGSGTVNVDVLGGTVAGGPGMGAGVEFSGTTGSQTFLNIMQPASVTGTSGLAILGGDSDDTAEVAGDVNGEVELLAGDDTFLLLPTASVNGPVDFGSGSDVLAFDGSAGTIGTISLFNSGTPFATNLETLEKRGEGIWFFTGDDLPASLPPVQGRIIDGTAIINSNLASINVVNEIGGRVEGIGGTGNLTNNGAFAPSNQMGVFNVHGDLVLNAPGTLEIDIFSDGTSDQIEVAGNTTLGGTLAVNAVGYPTGFPDAQDYIFITADDTGDTINGEFDTVTDNIPDLDVNITVNDAMTDRVDMDTGDPLPDIPANVVVGYDRGDSDASDKSIHPNSLQAGAGSGGEFTDLVQIRARTSNSGGTNAPASGSFALALLTSSSAASGERFDNTQGFSSGEKIPEGMYAWITGYGAQRDVDGSAAVTGYDATLGGVAFGIDTVFAHNDATITLGISGGYSNTNVDSGPSSADVETWHIGGYGSVAHDGWLFSGAVSYGFQDYDFARVIPVGMASVTANGEADGNVFSASLAASHDIAQMLGLDDNTRFAPLVRFDHVSADRDGFTETGAGILNLTVADDDFTRNFISLGFEASTVVELGNGSVARPNLEVRWEHAFSDNNAVGNAAIANVAGATFTTPGAFEDSNRAVIGAGVEIDISEKLTANFNYNGTFSSGFTDHRGSAGIRLKF
ncbi:MAG: autotransporter outer membrane beta-barrel domain-containing protein [Pseudomonadota bacterium]